MITETDEGKNRKNWVAIPGEKDIFFNMVCKKCGSMVIKSDSFYLSHDNPKLYCNNCGPEILKSGIILKVKEMEDITRDFACNVLNNEKTTKFISGRNIYVNFLIMVHNYRQKTDFCNY